ncbi:MULTISPECIES: MBL fold metallo-hydrolase [Pseudoalteromonas]|uniref:MBL fold metallo-hydrolase n=1 Tax=Pseudoalteromonas arctica TaxID=394751 RepID=A0ABU9THN1_9GAMM|nr:MBL fold metallo-hydrolase [Pseudoalteromonas sp. SA25]
MSNVKQGLAATALIMASFSSIGAQQCSDVSLQILGSGGPELDDGRASTSYLIWHEDKARVLVDVGSGASIGFDKAGAKFSDVDAILLSHLHTDHAGDLPSFIKGSYFTSRDKVLAIFGPQGNRVMASTNEYAQALLGKQGAFRYLSDYVEGNENYKLDIRSVAPTKQNEFKQSLQSDLAVNAMTVNHGPIPALAWKVSIAGCELVFAGDMTDKFGTFTDFAKNADVVVMHNAIDENASGGAKNLHITPSKITKVLIEAAPKTAVLSHFMNRSLKNQQLFKKSLIKSLKSNVVFAEDGLKINL